jgi:hypothetical protein
MPVIRSSPCCGRTSLSIRRRMPAAARQSSTLSALAPARRAGAQRFRALAHRVISRQCHASVALGVKRTSTSGQSQLSRSAAIRVGTLTDSMHLPGIGLQKGIEWSGNVQRLRVCRNDDDSRFPIHHTSSCSPGGAVSWRQSERRMILLQLVFAVRWAALKSNRSIPAARWPRSRAFRSHCHSGNRSGQRIPHPRRRSIRHSRFRFLR